MLMHQPKLARLCTLSGSDSSTLAHIYVFWHPHTVYIADRFLTDGRNQYLVYGPPCELLPHSGYIGIAQFARYIELAQACEYVVFEWGPSRQSSLL